MNKDNLGDRMKRYEKIPNNRLIRRMPVIIRIDGKAFHTFTRGMDKPFDNRLIEVMQKTALELCKNVQGCKLAYVQSDEISLLLTDYEKYETDAWFDNKVQKIVSVAASMASAFFNWNWFISEQTWEKYYLKKKIAIFDARCFNLSVDEVCNYFIWRQQDCMRNSISMVAQAHFSQKQLNGVNGEGMKKMLAEEKGILYEMVDAHKRNGTIIEYDKDLGKWVTNIKGPVFKDDRDFINRLL